MWAWSKILHAKDYGPLNLQHVPTPMQHIPTSMHQALADPDQNPDAAKLVPV